MSFMDKVEKYAEEDAVVFEVPRAPIVSRLAGPAAPAPVVAGAHARENRASATRARARARWLVSCGVAGSGLYRRGAARVPPPVQGAPARAHKRCSPSRRVRRGVLHGGHAVPARAEWAG